MLQCIFLIQKPRSQQVPYFEGRDIALLANVGESKEKMPYFFESVLVEEITF